MMPRISKQQESSSPTPIATAAQTQARSSGRDSWMSAAELDQEAARMRQANATNARKSQAAREAWRRIRGRA
jgi:hypothetical protein